MTGPDDLLTVNEIAQSLRVNPQTVRNWIDREQLTAIRVGSRRVRVRRQDLDAFVGARTGLKSPAPTGPEKPPVAPATNPELSAALRQLATAIQAVADAIDAPK
jgi:excisionase family DNA binding protein